MFTYLRYFSAISSLVILLAALAVGMYFRTLAERDLMNLVQRNNASLAQGFINTTWKSNRSVLQRLNLIEVSQWKRYKEFAAFQEEVFRYFEEIPIVRISLYTPKGVRILSTDQSFNTSDALAEQMQDADSRAIFQHARQGDVVSRIVSGAAFRQPDGSQTTGTLVHTLVPIISDNYVPVLNEQKKSNNIEGIIEVFYDVTPQWSQLYLFQVIGTGGIIIIFVVLITVLIMTSKKAEAIIAKQHEANLELAATAASAEAENRDKSQFLANISHELRTPLNAIIGFSEIIKNEVMGSLENTQYQDYIRDIHSSGVHLLSLINDILDYSKAEAGKLDLEISEVDATKIILNSMRLVSPRAETAGVRLTQNVPDEHFILKTDAKKLKQVMLNLLSNAVKFTPQNGEVRVSAWQNMVEDTLTIEVKDTGIGIAPKDISRAMSPFGQVDSALSRKYEGTGLGLPLTRKFVELMGGSFAIASEVNVGTTITINLPLGSGKGPAL